MRRDGATPLHCALFIGRNNVIAYLVGEACADIEKKDNRGYTPLNLAKRNRDAKIIRLMCKRWEDLGDNSFFGIDQAEHIEVRSSGIDLALQRYSKAYEISGSRDILEKLFESSIRYCDDTFIKGMLENDLYSVKDVRDKFMQTAGYLQEIKSKFANDPKLTALLRKFDNKLTLFSKILKQRKEMDTLNLLVKSLQDNTDIISEDRANSLLGERSEKSEEVITVEKSKEMVVSPATTVKADNLEYKVKRFEMLLHKMLEDSLHNDRVIIQGLAQRKEDTFDNVLKAASLLGGTMQNHWIGFVGGLGAEGVKQIRDKLHELACRKTNDFSNLHIGEVTRKAAKQVAERYKNQIIRLDPNTGDGIDRLAQYFHDKAMVKLHKTSCLDSFLKKIGALEEVVTSPEVKLFSKMVSIDKGEEGHFLRLDESITEYTEDSKRRNSNMEGLSWSTTEMLSTVAMHYDGKVYLPDTGSSDGHEKYGFCYCGEHEIKNKSLITQEKEGACMVM